MALSETCKNSVAHPAGDKADPDGTGQSHRKSSAKLLMNLGVIHLDPWLSPYKDALKSRFSKAQQWVKTIDETEGGIDKFTRGFEICGFTFSDNGDRTYREW